MLHIKADGTPEHRDAAMAVPIHVPHKRQVLRALRNIHLRAQSKKVPVAEDINVVCRFFGVTLDYLADVE